MYLLLKCMCVCVLVSVIQGRNEYVINVITNVGCLDLTSVLFEGSDFMLMLMPMRDLLLVRSGFGRVLPMSVLCIFCCVIY